jgi:hypothetical protein
MMGRYLIAAGFIVLFCMVIYLGAIVSEQQRAIEALVADQLASMKLQDMLVKDIQSLRRQLEASK